MKPTETRITIATGERFLQTCNSSVLLKLDDITTGFVVDTKPDLTASCILPDFLYLGSQDAVNLNTLLSCKITHILSVGIERPSIDLPNSIKCLYVPCLDLPEFQLICDTVLLTAMRFIEECRSANGSILIHCNAGVSRSPSITIAYLMKYYQMDFQTAYKLVKTKRPCIQPNCGFTNQLKTLSASN